MSLLWVWLAISYGFQILYTRFTDNKPLRFQSNGAPFERWVANSDEWRERSHWFITWSERKIYEKGHRTIHIKIQMKRTFFSYAVAQSHFMFQLNFYMVIFYEKQTLRSTNKRKRNDGFLISKWVPWRLHQNHSHCKHMSKSISIIHFGIIPVVMFYVFMRQIFVLLISQYGIIEYIGAWASFSRWITHFFRFESIFFPFRISCYIFRVVFRV